ncbi:MAG: penicillin-binding protein activator [Zetaproteobacteria bacterium CG1_02_53_45]|nr:MAG: penicillin-binding protein activator [Zetaproteobacteria bacterium CG1_02_53_45]
MLWTRYRSNPPAAMAAMLPKVIIYALLGAFSLFLLSACQPKQPSGISAVEKSRPGLRRMAPAPESAVEIQLLMRRAGAGEDVNQIMRELDQLIARGDPLIRDEALFRKAQLLLENQQSGAAEVTRAVIEAHPQHALVPYAYFWLAKWWISQDEPGRALEKMRQALKHERLTRELADDIFDVAPAITQQASEREAVYWLLAAAEVDQAGRDSWLRLAARRASMETIEQLHRDGTLPRDLIPDFDLHAGRSRLMTGDTEAVARIAQLLAASFPNHSNLRQLQAWASGEIRAATIGVLLPLSGPYARYGQEALRGIRIALAGLEFDEYITLRVEDTGSDSMAAITAYKRLADESVNLIIGPLLAETTEVLLPYLRSDLPVISLTGRTDLAAASPALFIHTLSPLAQIYVMAQHAWQHGATRMVVISGAADDQTEPEMFSRSFQALGGEISGFVQLEKSTMDHRSMLRKMRYETDDEVLLAELDEDLAVMLPKMDIEIRMPVGFDAVYLALDGRQVSMLAGQLAYAGINNVPLYGSSRWQDGHLLDDRGRYLSKARFAASNTSSAQNANQEDPDVRAFQFKYRQVWGDGKISDLMSLAFDTMRIATVMTSRLGLSRHEIVRALRTPEGFPALTGHVRFDESGVGQKQLDVFGIKNGEIVPAG